jgi:hypothetical protein
MNDVRVNNTQCQFWYRENYNCGHDTSVGVAGNDNT